MSSFEFTNNPSTPQQLYLGGVQDRGTRLPDQQPTVEYAPTTEGEAYLTGEGDNVRLHISPEAGIAHTITLGAHTGVNEMYTQLDLPAPAVLPGVGERFATTDTVDIREVSDAEATAAAMTRAVREKVTTIARVTRGTKHMPEGKKVVFGPTSTKLVINGLRTLVQNNRTAPPDSLDAGDGQRAANALRRLGVAEDAKQN